MSIGGKAIDYGEVMTTESLSNLCQREGGFPDVLLVNLNGAFGGCGGLNCYGPLDGMFSDLVGPEMEGALLVESLPVVW